MALLVASCFYLIGRVPAWPVPYEINADTMPNLEVGLSPPSQPLPQVAAAIRDMESGRERVESANIDEMQRFAKKELHRVRTRAGDIVGRAMRTLADSASLVLLGTHTSRLPASLMGARLGTPGNGRAVIQVVAVPAPPPSVTVERDIGAFGKIQVQHAQRMLDQAIADMTGVSDILLNEFQEQIDKHISGLRLHSSPNTLRGFAKEGRLPFRTGFVDTGVFQNSVRALPGQANVHIIAASSSPLSSLSASLQNMEARATTSELLGRSKILDIEMQLLKEEHRTMKDVLQIAVRRLVEAYHVSAAL